METYGRLVPRKRTARDEFRAVLDGLPDYAIFTLDRAGRIASWNSGAERLCGMRESEILGRGLAALFYPAEAAVERSERLLARARETGRGEDEGQHQTKAGQAIWVVTTVTTSLTPESQTRGYSVVMRNVTDRLRSEQREDTLAREVDHRVMNILAIVQAIVRLTRARDIESYASTIEGRVSALARAHNSIAKHRWGAVPIAEIVEGEIYSTMSTLRDSFAVSADNRWVTPAAAQALALALHELAANAVEQSASTPHWSGSLSTSGLAEYGIELIWSETAGEDPMANSFLSDFAMAIIRAMIENQLDGRVETRRGAGRLECRMTVPSRHTIEAHAAP